MVNRNPRSSPLDSDVESLYHFSPISKLNQDILSTIFMMNGTDITSPDSLPLATSRHSSQVCREWRSVILGYSLLWGRLIHFQELARKSETWRNEVLRRSRTAPLWIRGPVNGDIMRNFLLFLLNSHWTRVEKLDVKPISDNTTIGLSRSEADQIWSALSRPAPILQVFKISFGFINGRLFDDSEFLLFAQNAPVLRSFSAPDVVFNLTAPWLSGLRELSLLWPFTAAEDSAEVFDALQAIKSLEHLHLTSRVLNHYHENVARSPPPSIDLPRLTILRVSNKSLYDCFLILGNITPAPGCTLIIESTDDCRPKDLRWNLAKADVKRVVRHMRWCFARHTAHRVSLLCCTNLFHLAVYDSRDQIQLKIVVNLYYDFSPMLIEELAASSFFSHVPEADLKIEDPPVGPVFSPFISFFQSLPSVTNLRTNRRTLKIILKVARRDPPEPLPSLRFLVIHGISNMGGTVKEFLEYRQAVGLPVPDLNMVPDDGPKFDPDDRG